MSTSHFHWIFFLSETTTTTDLELERNLDVVSENGQNITTEVSNDEVDTIEDILKANVSEVDKIEDRMDIVNESETTEYMKNSRPSINLITAQNYVDFDNLESPF